MDVGLLILRLVIGALFVGHGTGKLFGWFAGHGVDGTAGYFASLGYRRVKAMAVVAGLTEVGAGLALAFGFLTPLAAAALIGVMINAAVTAHGKAGLWAENEGYEYPLVVAVLATALALGGPGGLSLDQALGWELNGVAWGVGAVAMGVISALIVLSTRRAVPDPVAADEQQESDLPQPAGF